MNNQEAIEALERLEKLYKKNITVTLSPAYYHPIIELAIKAMRKQTAKPMEPAKGTHGAGYEYVAYVCPTCKFPPKYDELYCSNCGQRLEVEG